jgi:hypothetical protein
MTAAIVVATAAGIVGGCTGRSAAARPGGSSRGSCDAPDSFTACIASAVEVPVAEQAPIKPAAWGLSTTPDGVPRTCPGEFIMAWRPP